jgi:hypothetical protein
MATKQQFTQSGFPDVLRGMIDLHFGAREAEAAGLLSGGDSLSRDR